MFKTQETLEDEFGKRVKVVGKEAERENGAFEVTINGKLIHTRLGFVSKTKNLTSDFKKPKCFAFIFHASSGFDKVQKKQC